MVVPEWLVWLVGVLMPILLGIGGYIKFISPRIIDARIEDQRREDQLRIAKLEADIARQQREFDAQVEAKRREFEAQQTSELRMMEQRFKESDSLLGILKEVISWLQGSFVEIEGDVAKLIAEVNRLDKHLERNTQVTSGLNVSFTVLVDEVRVIADRLRKDKIGHD